MLSPSEPDAASDGAMISRFLLPKSISPVTVPTFSIAPVSSLSSTRNFIAASCIPLNISDISFLVFSAASPIRVIRRSVAAKSLNIALPAKPAIRVVYRFPRASRPRPAAAVVALTTFIARSLRRANSDILDPYWRALAVRLPARLMSISVVRRFAMLLPQLLCQAQQLPERQLLQVGHIKTLGKIDDEVTERRRQRHQVAPGQRSPSQGHPFCSQCWTAAQGLQGGSCKAV
ncbi:Uncharacterised protein [Klebsiella variicola]|nr:Uncharacterised protein [Klebsiella variicola]